MITEQEAPVKTESLEEKNLREKQEARRLRLARSPPPVRRIAEQETPGKIESPEEKAIIRKKQEARRLRLSNARSPPPVRRISKPVQRYGSTGSRD